MSNLEQYRASENEKARTADLLRLLPRGRRSALDIGARDGHFSRLLADYFEEVTALDLQKPDFEFDRVVTVAGDATRLDFANDSFDCVFCAEVLEHIPEVQTACREIARVARCEVIVGVPYQQDTRIGRTTCRSCGKINPPWGHVNSFDEARLVRLFSELTLVRKSFVGAAKGRTNALSAWLMDLAGHPWGAYSQEEPCIHCGAQLIPPGSRPIWRRACSSIAGRINQVQAAFVRPRPKWIHAVFAKTASSRAGGPPRSAENLAAAEWRRPD